MSGQTAEQLATIIGGNCGDMLLKQAKEIESLKLDAKRMRTLYHLLNEGEATVVFMGRLDTIHTGLEVCDSGDFIDEIDAAIDAFKKELPDEKSAYIEA
jgi:hypothetical protein